MPEVDYLQNDDSMLSRRFGKEVVNYYAGGSINRFSFLRPDTTFLRKAALAPSSRFLALNNLSPLVADKSNLVYLTFEDVKPLIGTDLFQLTEDDYVKQFDSSKSRPSVIFLGLMEGQAGASDEFETLEHGAVKGRPFFAVDVTPKGAHGEPAEALLKAHEGKGHTIQTNPRALTLHSEDGME